MLFWPLQKPKVAVETAEVVEEEAGDGSSSSGGKKNKKKKKSDKKKKKRAGPPLRHPEWLMDTMPRKTPYFPQVGDELVYFHQGHQSYVQTVKRCRAYHIRDRLQPYARHRLRVRSLFSSSCRLFQKENDERKRCSLWSPTS